METKFHNPYDPAIIGDVPTKVIATRAPIPDYNLIRCTRPAGGTISGTLSTLFQKLCYELHLRGITDATKVDEFEHFVANCRIISGDERDVYNERRFCNSTTDAREPGAPNDRSGTPGIHNTPTHAPTELPDVQSDVRGQRSKATKPKSAK